MSHFKKILEDGVRSKAFPGAVLLVGDDKSILFEETVGHLTYDPTSSEVQPNTIYDLASLTKVVVTTTLAMQLYEEGKLELDARVDEFTIRQLLTHSAGLPPEATLEIVAGHRPPLRYEPGTQTLYSDAGFIVLGRIIEQTAGAPLDDLSRERIFGPLGMIDTCFNPNSVLFYRAAPTSLAESNLDVRVHDSIAAAMGGVAGHAGLFSTARELAVFSRMMLHGGNTIELFTRLDGRVPGSTRALGWDTPSDQDSSSGHYFSKQSFGHTGFTGTSMWIDPVRNLYVILLTNRVYPTSDNLEIRRIRPQLHDAVIQSLLPAAPGNARQ